MHNYSPFLFWFNYVHPSTNAILRNSVNPRSCRNASVLQIIASESFTVKRLCFLRNSQLILHKINVLLRQKVWGHAWHCSIAFTECCICCLSPELSCSLNLIILHITYRVSNTEAFRLSSAISDWLLTVTACTVLFSFPCGRSALDQFPLRVSWAGLQYQFFHFLLLRWWLL